MIPSTNSLKDSLMVYDHFNLYICPDNIFIEPIQNTDILLNIDRIDFTYKKEVNNGQIPKDCNHQQIFGLLGIIKLLVGPYIVIIKGKKLIGKISGHDIWQLIDVDLIPLPKTKLHLNETQIQMDLEYVNMVKQTFNTPYYYFSYTYDLTHSMQRLYYTSPSFLETPMYERADKRFLWNHSLLSDFCIENHKFCVPIIHGFIAINYCVLNGKHFIWTIVSRRSWNRHGPRLLKRGIDHDGNVANFVETEMIVEYNNTRSSYIQTRGSIPLFWSQYPTLKYKPVVQLATNENHLEAATRHFNEQILLYGQQILINLIDHRGAEQELERKYHDIVNMIDSNKIKYEAFDFHCECKKMRWDRLSILINRVAHEQDNLNYFLLGSDGKLLISQKGIFRTNCIDCLDRTNVVQSLLGRRMLTIMLQKLDILHIGQKVEDQYDLESLFKTVWADHADIISIQYSGTGALKTDFTRTGKRTYNGMLRDLKNSLIRYYKNNLKDGVRQDCIDLVLGNYKVNNEESASLSCPLEVKPALKYIMYPIILMIALAMFMANAIFTSEYSTGTYLFLLFWGSMVICVLSLILYYGKEFVNYPRLSNFDNGRRLHHHQS
ncbi:phosphatidylinositol-3-phosphatase SAC1 [Daktulosphaira vitifoliae]|uniref:phosphatidylinositol-3-phosphatase SAC1 n=1 Tax=Daktulosphaira vitifoliae TaxID=58002 RepID=UPI0021AA2EA0|nr:phosphatidylinositol-3-phosphatase SAC1 [Daktulosphaira vitifoliae]